MHVVRIVTDDRLKLALRERGGVPTGTFALFRLAWETQLRTLARSFDELSCLAALPNLVPYPHQIETALHVIRNLHGRALIADEVGLGKTIEAGLILKEYMLRGLVRKALVLVPASLVLQWTRELCDKFGIPAFAQRNEWSWSTYDILVASLDTTKREPNRSAVLDIAYDLVIVDEAHKLKNAATRNWQLVEALRKKYLLLVTATPIQNDVRDLYNLVQLLYPGRLGSARSFATAHVQTKRCAKDPAALRQVVGEVMVRNRRAHTDVAMTDRHVQAVAIELSRPERQLYDELTAFVRDQYVRRTARKRSVLSLITLQREICSSSYAAIGTLEAMQKDKRASVDEIAKLRELASLAEAVPSYAKVNHVLETVRRLDDKVIIFTEYRATQDFLLYMLQQSGVRTVLFRGGYRRGKKDWMKDLFEQRAQVLIATEAGGEGINLQFCNRVINFDLPWNPMRVEQRIGRVHRVGQTRPVFVENYATIGTIEEHIVRLLQNKIRLFESIVGELDVILGPRAFEESIMDAFATSADDAELRARLSALAGRVKRADSGVTAGER